MLLMSLTMGLIQDQPAFNIDLSNVTAPAINPRIFGCHHDPGFAQAPHGFLANLVVGSAPTLCASCSSNPSRVPLWTPRPAGARLTMQTGTSFAGRSTLGIASSGINSSAVNRGLGGAGFSLDAGKPYEFSAWIYQTCDCDVFVELRDSAANASLARSLIHIKPTGPGWGATWAQYNVTLVPEAATSCVGIPYGSDPSIDCGQNAGGGVVCARCGGELVVGVAAPSKGANSVSVGYVSLMPGAWGRLAGPDGPLPVLKSGASMLEKMGVTLMRAGGTVSQSFRSAACPLPSLRCRPRSCLAPPALRFFSFTPGVTQSGGRIGAGRHGTDRRRGTCGARRLLRGGARLR